MIKYFKKQRMWHNKQHDEEMRKSSLWNNLCTEIFPEDQLCACSYDEQLQDLAEGQEI